MILLIKKQKKKVLTCCCSLCFLAMESSTTTTLSQACSQANPQQPQNSEDEKMVTAEVPAAYTALTDEEKKSDFVDGSFFTKKGIVVQFINGNCPGSTSMIGGIRLSLTDIRKAPAYVSKYRQQIKAHAVKFLTTHLQAMQCSIGATETLAPEDYGMTFSMASLSGQGIHLNPNKRNEAPMFYCLLSGLIAPVVLQHEAWEYGIPHDEAYMLNAYINLLPKGQRRNQVIRQAKEDKAIADAPRPAQALEMLGASPKKPKFAPSPFKQNVQSHKAAQERSAMQDEILALKREMDRMKRAPISAPHLPKVKPLVWPARDTCPELPSEL